MKLRFVAVVLACVLLATGAWAQFAVGISPRVTAMGGAGIGVCNDAAAVYQNPAGLAALGVPVPDGASYGSQGLFGYANTDDHEGYIMSLSGWKPSGGFGYGAAYANAEGGLLNLGPTGSHVFAAGLGGVIGNSPLSVGVNILSVGGKGSGEYVTAGMLYRISQSGDRAPVRLGVTAFDIFDDTGSGPSWNVGVGWEAVKNLLVAVDASDLTDEIGNGVLVSGGVEYGLSDAAGRQYFLRGGLMDTGTDNVFTAGLGYKSKDWHVDFSYVDTSPNSTWTVGLSTDL